MLCIIPVTLYKLFIIVLEASKQALAFFKPKKALKICVLLECFQNFCWIPIMNHYCGSWYFMYLEKILRCIAGWLWRHLKVSKKRPRISQVHAYVSLHKKTGLMYISCTVEFVSCMKFPMNGSLLYSCDYWHVCITLFSHARSIW